MSVKKSGGMPPPQNFCHSLNSFQLQFQFQFQIYLIFLMWCNPPVKMNCRKQMARRHMKSHSSKKHELSTCRYYHRSSHKGQRTNYDRQIDRLDQGIDGQIGQTHGRKDGYIADGHEGRVHRRSRSNRMSTSNRK